MGIPRLTLPQAEQCQDPEAGGILVLIGSAPHVLVELEMPEVVQKVKSTPDHQRATASGNACGHSSRSATRIAL